MPTITFDLSQSDRARIGARLIGYLYYPCIGPDDLARAAHFNAHFQAILRAKARSDPHWASTPQWLVPNVALMTETDFKKAVRTSIRRERDRRMAGRMAVALLTEAMTGKAPVLPKGIDRLALVQLAEFLKEETDEEDPVNIVKRAWNPSKPVIHLAAALEIYWRRAEETAHKGIHADLPHVPGALEFVIETAREHEEAVLANKAFGVTAEKMLRFRLVG